MDDPFEKLAWLRAEQPVFFHAELKQWFVFRYEDATALYNDPRLTANRMAGFVDAAPEAVRDELRQVAPMFETWLLMQDDPAHGRVRKALHAGFSLAAVKGPQPAIAAAARELLTRRDAAGRFDACADYAFLLPAYVLSDLLGVRPEDRDRVVQWSVDFVDFFNIVPITADSTCRMVTSALQMAGYTRELIDARRAASQDDFLGGLVRGQSLEDGLSDDEIVGNAMLLLLAGHVAVRNLIGNLLWLLLDHPEQMAALRADRGLMPRAIEEALRFEPPVTMIPRIALQDIEFGGQTIKAGDIVQLHLASANRDEQKFENAATFDIMHRPGKHLSFGVGAHACLGVLLARDQTTIARSTCSSPPIPTSGAMPNARSSGTAMQAIGGLRPCPSS